MSSLNATRKWNVSSPSCASGISSKLAVSGGGPVSGPSTVVEISSDSERPSAVQTAPGSSHGRPPSIRTVTSPSESGSISNSHTAFPSSVQVDPGSPHEPSPEGVAVSSFVVHVDFAVPVPSPVSSGGACRADRTRPPSTCTPCLLISSSLASIGSLNVTFAVIRFVPSCRSGIGSNRPISGASDSLSSKYVFQS